jgi:pseudaminic acid cytidylyltransferase
MIAVIPARGGSKRVKRKNLKNFNGIPLIERALEKIDNSGLFSQVFVSTDDTEIAKLAEKLGTKVVMRESELSNDSATTLEVISNFARKFEKSFPETNPIIGCIYPAIPLIDLRYRVTQALELLKTADCDYVFPIMPIGHPIERSMTLNPSSFLKLNSEESISQNTQHFQQHFFDAGQFYLGKLLTWKEQAPIISAKSRGLVLEKYEVIDIDDEADWRFAEELHDLRSHKSTK